MEMLYILLWIVYPYCAAAIFVMGLVWHYDAATMQEGQWLKPSRLLRGTVKCLLALSFVTGIAIVVAGGVTKEPQQLFRWVVSLVQFQPDLKLIENISILSQVHFILVTAFLLGLSFTNNVSYLVKPHLYIKKKIKRIN